jgi:replicative DNA helicase
MTVVEKLKTNEDLDFVGGPYYVAKLTNEVTSSANVEDHIRLISEVYMKREAIRLGGELVSEAYEDYSDPFDIIHQADAGFQKIQEQVSAGSEKDIAYFGMKVLDQHAVTKETGILGVSTGLRAIDNVICGLVAPDLIILAARPGQGKTALALSITYNTSILRDEPCAWFSLEMDGIQLVRRLASMDTGINHENIRKANTDESEEKRLHRSIENISTKKIYIEDKPAVNIRYIRTRAHLLKKKRGIKYIVVDYLQLMKPVNPKDSNRESVVSEISRSLKELAKELELPIIALSQLSREVEKRPNKMPQLSDLRESGSIEQDADEVIFLMRPDYYGMLEPVEMGGKEYDVKGLTVVKTDKNRHGDTKSTPLYFDGPTMMFKDHENYIGGFVPVSQAKQSFQIVKEELPF